MSSSRLYVGNLAYSTTDEGLRNFFAVAGEVKSAEIVIEYSSPYPSTLFSWAVLLQDISDALGKKAVLFPVVL